VVQWAAFATGDVCGAQRGMKCGWMGLGRPPPFYL